MTQITLANIAEVLSGEAAKVITRKSPYDSLVLGDEYAAFLKRFYDRGHTLPLELQTEYIQALVTLSKARMLWCFGLLQDNVAESFPGEYHLVSAVNTLLATPPGLAKIGPEMRSKVELNRVLTGIMAETFADFRFHKCREGSITIKFFKTLALKQKFYIQFDHGTFRQWTVISIGMDSPQFTIDVAWFFGSGSSMLPYADISAYDASARRTLCNLQPLINAISQKFSTSFQQEGRGDI